MLGLCVVDMLLVRVGVGASLSKGPGDVVAEDGVLGAEAFDLGAEGVEAGGGGLGGGTLSGGDVAGTCSLSVGDDGGAEVELAVEPGA